MNRFLGFFTIERAVGLFMLGLAALLFWRPYATALFALNELYGIIIQTSLLTAMILLCGGVLLIRRTVSVPLFALLLSPLVLYSLCLSWIFILRPTMGPIGSAVSLGFCGLCVYVHAAREMPVPATEPPMPETKT